MCRALALLPLLLAACSPWLRSSTQRAPASANADFARATEAFFHTYLADHPGFGVSLGYHEFDGRLPDVSRQGIERSIEHLREAERRFAAFAPEDLGFTEQLERDTLLLTIRSDLQGYLELRSPWRNPIGYDGALELDGYLSRDYAPLEQRARAVIAIARGAPAYLAAARANLEPVLPEPWVEIARFEIDGQLDFLHAGLKEALAPLTDPGLRRELDEALVDLAGALEAQRAFLDARRASADQSHVLGANALARVLAVQEDVDLDLATISAIGRADLERNQQALAEAVRAVDPSRPAAQVIEELKSLKPADVLSEARRQAEDARRFVIEHDLVGLPSNATAEVREAPPYDRSVAAMLDSAGPFEPDGMPSFYLISPPDPGWSAAEQRDYVPDTWDLLVVTTHELYPGHFVDDLHRRAMRSRVLKSFWHQLTGEGWAHYAEELMWEQGFTGRDPRFRVAQLREALIRDVRLVCAVGIHAEGMSLDECARRMREDAFLDEAGARQEAMRGTYDPTYLSYTLGKHLILALREEWRAKMGPRFSLRAFHDRFLACGGAPISAVRRALLGDHSADSSSRGSRDGATALESERLDRSSSRWGDSGNSAVGSKPIGISTVVLRSVEQRHEGLDP